MGNNRSKSRSIRFGDPRVFAETTLTKPFVSGVGITYDPGACVRMTAHLDIEGKNIATSLPSMAELIYFQASKLLAKASTIKRRALKVRLVNNHLWLVNEELFYTYIQCCSLGVLGLYSALESMVYELYIRKSKERPIMIRDKQMTFKQFIKSGV